MNDTIESAELTAKSNRPKKFQKKDYLLAVVILAASWVYVRGREYLPGSWLPVFTVLFLAAGLLFLRQSSRKLTGEGKFYLALTAAAGAWFLVKYLPWQPHSFEEQDIMPYVTLFLHGTGVYWLLTIAGSRMASCLDECAPLDLGRGLFVLPFMNFGKLFCLAAEGIRGLKRRFDAAFRKDSGKEGEVSDESRASSAALRTLGGQILIGLVISIPVLLIVLPMLAAADDSFRLFAGQFGGWCKTVMNAFFGLFTFGQIFVNLMVILTACYLFGLFYGAFYAKAPKRPGKGTLPSAVLMTFATVICGVYLLFFLVKVMDMSGVLARGEGEIVYSSYARQGFFELVFIAVINFGLFYFIKILSAFENSRICRALTVLGMETLGFILLAFSKMSLYISVYGFTFKRVFTSWFMCVLFLTFTLLIRAVWKKGNAIRPSVWFASVSFLLLAYSNIDWWMEFLNCYLNLGV